MSVNLASGVIPFTELFERVMTTARIDSFNNEDYAKGLVNDTYTRNIPRLLDWEPLTSEGWLATSAAYSTGTVSCTLGSSSVSGSGTAWTSSMLAANGWKIKFAGNDAVYSFTRTADTSATISPALVGVQSIVSGAYAVFCDEYALPADFDRFLRNGSIYNIVGGRMSGDPIGEASRDEFRACFVPDSSDPIRRAMLSRTQSSTGLQMVRVNPPPRTSKLYPYDYIRKYAPMFEYTVGTVSVTAGSPTITGSGTVWDTNVVAGMYFRIDAVGRADSSKWYKIASVTDADTIVLESNYLDGTESGADYTICSSPSELPPKFHDFILYDAAAMAALTQDDPAVEGVMSKRNDLLEGLQRDYRGRRTNAQFSIDDEGLRT